MSTVHVTLRLSCGYFAVCVGMEEQLKYRCKLFCQHFREVEYHKGTQVLLECALQQQGIEKESAAAESTC